ncbi:MAG: hypothetical protein DSM107014_06640 [Gomphosphaeria aponina SAG 52.96 = DSM 107014]|uniref:Phytanoyl-CoA dioxygenase n=1 Tax=Gomphosphaeria aponina SAG 52.96 = DSM 107014 TaxID=1521640 RepID=A0A941JUU5_9CHRO|nr:hypothetical protein [Gomphosphaeria aponina SAG 52.96 = DSM 107014]
MVKKLRQRSTKKILFNPLTEKNPEAKCRGRFCAEILNPSLQQLYLENRDLINNLVKHNQLEREYIRNQGTQNERYLYHQLARIFKQEIFTARAKLGEEYISNNQDSLVNAQMEITAGIAITSLRGYPPFEAALAEAEKIITARKDNELPSKGSLDFLASSKKDFALNSAITQLALDPNLIIPITKYFGFLPIVFGFDINRAKSKKLLNWSSHLYHLDPEDIQQIKVFIYLSDVDENSGPFTALPADKSRLVTEQLHYTIGRLKDQEVDKIVGKGQEKVCLGAKGTVVFCDTNSCLHYGGRIKEKERYVLTIYYALPTSTWFPLFPGDGERRNLTPLLSNVTDTLLEKALLGDELLLPEERALSRYEQLQQLVNG